MKRIMASILAIAMCASAYIAFNGNVAEASQDTLASGDFKMVGASVRFEDEATVNGIRFGIGIKESVYSGLDASVKNSIRLLVMPTKLVDGDLEIGETYTNGTATASAIDTAIGAKWDLKTYEDGNYYVTYVYLYDIDNTCYDIDVTARAYWRADENSSPVYTDAVERSYIYVAEAALNDVAAEESTAYPNAVGTKFSPYTATQRDALIDVPYEQTANTIWDYVDGTFVKKGEDNSDQFIYDRRVDASKDFKVYFTHKMQTGSYTGQTRFLNFGANADGSQCFEFDFTEPTSGSGVYKVHCRRIGTEGGFIETGHDFTFTSGETYDFLLNVTYSGTTMTADLKARVHDSHTAYKSVRSSKFSKTYNTLEVGNKFGYCLHAESRQATFEIEKGDVYRCNIYKNDGTTSRLATGVNVTELVNGLQISGYTTSGSESYCMLLDRYTQPYSTGANNANFTVTVDVACDYSTTSSFAGFIVGNITGNDYGDCGAHKRVRLYKTKLQVNGTDEFQLNATTMGEAAYATYLSNIESGKPNTVKCVFTTDQSTNKTTVVGYINGIQVGICSFNDTDIWENRIELTATDNATFTNLAITKDSYPVNLITTQAGVTVNEVSDKLQISGYAANGAESYCAVLNKYAYDKATYGNNNANFTLSVDIAADYYNDSCFAGFVVGYHNTSLGGAHKRIRLFKNKLQVNGTAEFQINATTMGETAYATYLSNIEKGIPNTVKCVFTSDQTTNKTTMVGYINGVQVGACSFNDTDIYENRFALSATTNATFSNLVIE